MRHKLVTGCPVSRYEQFEKSPETIEQELLTPTDRQTVKENYNIDIIIYRKRCVSKHSTVIKPAQRRYKGKYFSRVINNKPMF